MPSPPANAVARAFIEQSRTYLGGVYLPKIRRCLDVLPDEDLWWRPNPRSNSVGNLIVHLAGNIRQWVISGLGGAPDARDRQAEFEAREGGPGGPELMALLEDTLHEVDRALADLHPDILLTRRVIQGREVLGLEALYHAVEHFSMHTGQIVFITKQRTGIDLAFYDVKGGIARPTW